MSTCKLYKEKNADDNSRDSDSIYIHLPFIVEDTKDDGEGGGELVFFGSINTVRVTV